MHNERYAPQEGYRHSSVSGYFGHHDQGYVHGGHRQRKGYEFDHRRSERGDRGDGGYGGPVDRRLSVVAPRPVRAAGILPELHECGKQGDVL
ncbi:hypothetical protein IAT38_002405 [Cryptococcus sp. DSM 104549]